MEINIEAYSEWAADKWLRENSNTMWYDWIGTAANGNHRYELKDKYKEKYNQKKIEISLDLLKFVEDGNNNTPVEDRTQ